MFYHFIVLQVVTLPVRREKLIQQIDEAVTLTNGSASQSQTDSEAPKLIQELPSPTQTRGIEVS